MKAADPDRPLLEPARAGDYRAFAALVDRHGPRLFGLALGILRQREDAEDVVQSTFMNALEHLDEFREEAAFGTWLGRIAVNRALNILRKRRGLSTVPLDAEGGGEPLPHPDFIADWRDDPLTALERTELAGMLEAALDELPEGQRLVFLLRDVEGLSVEETARALGLGEGNVRVRLLRARLALRERLTRLFGDETRRVSGAHAHAPEGEKT